MITERNLETARRAKILEGEIERKVKRENLPIQQNRTMINLMKIAIIIAIIALVISIISLARTLC